MMQCNLLLHLMSHCFVRMAVILAMVQVLTCLLYTSLEGQKNMLTRFAEREEMIIVDTYEDAGKSGKSIEGRPAFQKMLRDIAVSYTHLGGAPVLEFLFCTSMGYQPGIPACRRYKLRCERL